MDLRRAPLSALLLVSLASPLAACGEVASLPETSPAVVPVALPSLDAGSQGARGSSSSPDAKQGSETLPEASLFDARPIDAVTIDTGAPDAGTSAAFSPSCTIQISGAYTDAVSGSPSAEPEDPDQPSQGSFDCSATLGAMGTVSFSTSFGIEAHGALVTARPG